VLRKKSWMIVPIVLAACAAVLIAALCMREDPLPFEAAQAAAAFEVRGGRIYRAGERFEMRGVSLSVRAGEDYEQLLGLVSGMNANTLFVEEAAPEAFYEAFARFNQAREEAGRPVYLLQSVPAGKHRPMVDMLHACGAERWVMGYVVEAGDAEASDAPGAYAGDCLYTAPSAGRREARLARAGDEILCYEAGRYGVQRLIAFAGDSRTDPVRRDVRARADGLNADTDFEKILAGDALRSGVLALYRAEAQEEFFSNEPFYASGTDGQGRPNPYAAYLIELCDHHEMPVVISGMSVSSARGIMSEQEQAQAMRALYEDVLEAGCAGALLSGWQDEWTLWHNRQDAAQTTGVIARDAGAQESVCVVDGTTSDWERVPLAAQGDGLLLQMQYDAAHVYLRLYAEGLDWTRERLYVPIELAAGMGGCADVVTGETSGEVSREDIDFVLVIEGADRAYLLQHRDFDRTADVLVQEGEFVGIYSLLRRADGQKGALLAPAGEMHFGSESVDSQADIVIRGSGAEVRIAWELLGFENPAQGLLRSADGRTVRTRQLRAWLIRRGERSVQTGAGSMPLERWDEVHTHIRLKPAYYEMRDAFGAEGTCGKGENAS